MASRFVEHGLPPLHYLGRTSGPPPVWLEIRAPLEQARLRRHPVFAGEDQPRGDGRAVLVVPGFAGGDGGMAVLRDWLERLGYRAAASGLAFNIRYSEAVLAMLTARLMELYAEEGRRVAIVGHSRGGLLAKVLAHRYQALVEQVAGMGSPFAEPFDLHPVTMAGVRAAQLVNLVRFGRSGRIERGFLADLAEPARVPLTSIYSRSDGIVHWEACLRPDATCVEVRSSHVGLAFSWAAYSLLAGLLAGRLPGA